MKLNHKHKTTVKSLIFLIIIIFQIKGHAEERAELWIDLYMGEPVSFAGIIEDIKSVDVVYLGEVHTIKRHHLLQKLIIEALFNSGKSVTLGIEQMEAVYQPFLDKYNRKQINFYKLAEQTEWEERWSGYNNYREIIETVNKKGGDVIALNAKSETIRKIGKKGIDSLSKDERNELPEKMNFNYDLQKKLLGIMLQVHAMMDPDKLEPVIKAQMARDEMMAHQLYKYMIGSKKQDRIIVVVGGIMHFSNGLGVPKRLKERLPSVKDRIIIFSESGDLVLSAHDMAIASSKTLTHEDLRFLNVPIADYLHVIENK